MKTSSDALALSPHPMIFRLALGITGSPHERQTFIALEQISVQRDVALPPRTKRFNNAFTIVEANHLKRQELHALHDLNKRCIISKLLSLSLLQVVEANHQWFVQGIQPEGHCRSIGRSFLIFLTADLRLSFHSISYWHPSSASFYPWFSDGRHERNDCPNKTFHSYWPQRNSPISHSPRQLRYRPSTVKSIQCVNVIQHSTSPMWTLPGYRKKGFHRDPKSYRPMNHTSAVCKIMDKTVQSKVHEYLCHNDLLHVSQNGFIKRSLCSSSQFDCLNGRTSSCDKVMLAIIVDLDMTKAFDRVSRNRLISKIIPSGLSTRRCLICPLTVRPPSNSQNRQTPVFPETVHQWCYPKQHP